MRMIEPVAVLDVRPWGTPAFRIADINGDGREELLITDRETAWVFRPDL